MLIHIWNKTSNHGGRREESQQYMYIQTMSMVYSEQPMHGKTNIYYRESNQ